MANFDFKNFLIVGIIGGLVVTVLGGFLLHYFLVESPRKKQLKNSINESERLITCKMYEEGLNQLLKIPEEIASEYPPLYARLKHAIGICYWKEGLKTGDENQLNKAINSFEMALRVRTSQNDPLNYAETQTHLGTVYAILSQTRDVELNIEKAFNAFNEALKLYTFENYPEYYAQIQGHIGISCNILARYRDAERNLLQSIKAHKEAMKVFTLEKNPQEYAKHKGI